MSTGSKGLASSAGAPRSFVLDRTPALSINWGALPLLNGVRIRHLLPDSMGELLNLLQTKEPLLEDTTKPYFIKVASNPFSEDGALRLPYYARVSMKVRKAGSNCVIASNQHVGRRVHCQLSASK